MPETNPWWRSAKAVCMVALTGAVCFMLASAATRAWFVDLADATDARIAGIIGAIIAILAQWLLGDRDKPATPGEQLPTAGASSATEPEDAPQGRTGPQDPP